MLEVPIDAREETSRRARRCAGAGARRFPQHALGKRSRLDIIAVTMKSERPLLHRGEDARPTPGRTAVGPQQVNALSPTLATGLHRCGKRNPRRCGVWPLSKEGWGRSCRPPFRSQPLATSSVDDVFQHGAGMAMPRAAYLPPRCGRRRDGAARPPRLAVENTNRAEARRVGHDEREAQLTEKVL